MITQTERKKIKNYFKRFPKWALWNVLISIPFVLLSGIGLIGIAVGGFFIHRWTQRISDRQFDMYKSKSLQELRKLALIKLRVDETELVRDNECIVSAVYKNSGFIESGFRKGKDKVARYNPIKVNFIFFTEHKLCIYQCILDLFTGNPLNIETSKFYYTEIVAIQRMSNAYTIKEEEIDKKILKTSPHLKKKIVNGFLQVNTSEQIILSTTGGGSVKIALPDYSILNSGVTGEMEESRADQAIASVEAMVDSKKIRI